MIKETIENIWANHRNELIQFLEERGQGIYDEAILEQSLKDDKEEWLAKAAQWLRNDMLKNNAFEGRLHRMDIIEGIVENFVKSMEYENR